MGLTAPSSTLTGQTIAASYDQVLFLDAAAGVTEATLKIVSGTAGKTALQISDEHVLIKGVDTNNAAGFEVQQTDGTSILKVAAGTPAATLIAPLTVGSDGNGHDVIFYGDTANGNMTWDESEDDLVLNDARLFINQDANVTSLMIDSEATSNYAFHIDDAANTTAYVHAVTSCDDLTSGGIAYFHSDSADNTSRSLVLIQNNHASAVGATCLSLDQNANEPSIRIDSEATTDYVVYFAAPATDEGIVLFIDDCNSLTTGGIAKFYSSAASTSPRNLVEIVNNNSLATGATALRIHQGSTGYAMDVRSKRTSAADTGAKLRLHTDDTNPMESGHRLGVIEFAGAEDGSNTITTGARIEALTTETWDDDDNDADLLFYTTSGDASQSEKMRITSDGRGLSQFTAKAWVNINGTASTAVARDSHNISSVDDNDPGNYDANFTNALANTNYVAFSECQANHKSAINNVQTSYMQILIRQDDGSDYVDSAYGFMIAFGD